MTGANFAGAVAFHPIEEKHLCEVRVKPGRRRYTVEETQKHGGKKQQLYIRTGNQTVALTTAEAID